MSRVHKRVLKLVNLFVQNLQKPYMIDLGTHSPLICDAFWSICHTGGLWAPLQNCFAVLHPCASLDVIRDYFRYFLWPFHSYSVGLHMQFWQLQQFLDYPVLVKFQIMLCDSLLTI